MAVLHALFWLSQIAHALHAPIHYDQGPLGWCVWIQPRGLVLGLADIRGHLSVYFETQ